MRNILGATWQENFDVSRSQEDYTTQNCEEIEGRVTKKLPKEFSRTETRILGALARPQEPANSGPLRNRSGDVPERF